jgi:transcriptional regulator with XRE-family HTH domain
MTELEWLQIFGDNLADMLNYARMTQRELADETGLSESSISNYIKKNKIPGIKALINISYALDCDVSDLIDFGDRIE